MFPKHLALVAAALAAAIVTPLSVAAPIVVDGQLDDWGAVVADGYESNFLNLKSDIGLVGYARQDAGDGNIAIQNYDVEFMGVAVQDTSLYISIVTGQRPDNGFAHYSPGDIFIGTTSGFYAVEIGGGTGGGAGTAITEGAAGSTYAVGLDGSTLTHTAANPQQTAGSVWTGVNTVFAPILPLFTQFTVNAGSQHVGDADYIYTRNSATGQHAVIELELDTAMFGDNTLVAFFWAPSSGADFLFVRPANNGIQTTAPRQQTAQVPEPDAVALFGLGLSALVAARLRRRRARHT